MANALFVQPPALQINTCTDSKDQRGIVRNVLVVDDLRKAVVNDDAVIGKTGSRTQPVAKQMLAAAAVIGTAAATTIRAAAAACSAVRITTVGVTTHRIATAGLAKARAALGIELGRTGCDKR
jgi:hypothetical protein